MRIFILYAQDDRDLSFKMQQTISLTKVPYIRAKTRTYPITFQWREHHKIPFSFGEVVFSINFLTPYGVPRRVCTTHLRRSLEYTNNLTKFEWLYLYISILAFQC